MRVNKLIMDITRGYWAMSFQGIDAYLPVAEKILAGEEVNLPSTSSILQLVDSNQNFYGFDPAKMEIQPNSYGVVDMIGPVVKYGDMCSYGADDIVKALDFLNNNKNIKGIVLNVDGPGGGVSAIGPFLEFAKRKQKPVIAMADMCASLHYWTACGVADFIMADNDVSAMFGSVGVVFSFMDNTEYLKNSGFKLVEIYPQESEHKNLAFTLAREGKFDMIKKEHLSPLAISFQNAVKQSRPNLKEEVGVLTGKTFYAKDALDLGMIDGIGGMQKALDMIDMLTEIRNFNK